MLAQHAPVETGAPPGGGEPVVEVGVVILRRARLLQDGLLQVLMRSGRSVVSGQLCGVDPACRIRVGGQVDTAGINLAARFGWRQPRGSGNSITITAEGRASAKAAVTHSSKIASMILVGMLSLEADDGCARETFCQLLRSRISSVIEG